MVLNNKQTKENNTMADDANAFIKFLEAKNAENVKNKIANSPETISYADSVQMWVDAACERDLSKRTTNKELYGSYTAWCDASRLHPLGRTSWGREMNRLKFISVRSQSTRSYWGIGLKSGYEAPKAPEPENVIFRGTTLEMLEMVEQFHAENNEK
jgi:phage/plasmid-associated DNA primase